MKLNIPPISQCNDLWASKKLGTSASTIGNSGCVITCVSMLCTYYKHPILPDALNDWLIANSGYASRNLLKWETITNLYPDIIWKERIDCLTTPAPLGRIDELLDQKTPVIVLVDFNPNTKEIEQHFVLIIGKDNNDYFINDPLMGETYWLSAKYGDPKKAICGLRIYIGILPQEPSTPTPDPQNSNIELLQRVDELSLRIAEAEIRQTKNSDEVNKIVPRLDSIAHDISDLNKDRAILETIQGKMAGIEEKVKLNSETVKSSETNLKAEIRGLQASTSDEIESIKVRVKVLEEKPTSETGITIIKKWGRYFLGKLK